MWHIEWLIDGRWQKWQCPTPSALTGQRNWFDQYEDQEDCEDCLTFLSYVWASTNRATALRAVAPDGRVTLVVQTENSKREPDAPVSLRDWAPAH
jgi:hypothetical protein